jgi:hypothetical protein
VETPGSTNCDSFPLAEKLFTIVLTSQPSRALSRCHNWLRSIPGAGNGSGNAKLTVAANSERGTKWRKKHGETSEECTS